jgi:hypothetical protein
MPEAGARFR